MKLFSKILPVALCGALLLVAVGCGGGEKYQPYDYEVKHASGDNVLRFYSSDNGLDAFLNDYFERHMRYNERRIHAFPVGAGQPVWKEWESMIGSFWDASPANLTEHYATNRWVRDWLTFDYMSLQDRQGYISTSTGITSSDWGQGWAFPSYRHNNMGGFGEEFTDGIDGWQGENGTNVSHFTQKAEGSESADGTEGYLAAETAVAASEICVVSPLIRGGKGTNAFYSPFLHFSWKYELTQGEPSDLDDLYVYFQTKDDANWSDDKCVRFSEYATVAKDFSQTENVWQGTFLNMYLNEKWGRDSLHENMVTRLKFVLRAKEGKKVQGKLLYNFIRSDFDDRMSDNCGQYISAAKHYLSYTQDTELLKTVLPNARRALQFYLTCLNGEQNGIIDNSYLVGHFNCGTPATGIGISDGFWDAISFPNANLYSNLSYHQALEGMLFLEQMAEEYDVESPAVTVLGKDMKTVVPYQETISSLREKLERCENVMREKFWDDEKGRFFAGYYDTQDGTGVTTEKMDYGFLMFNLQAVTDGIATPAQAERILSWVSGEREIAGDTSKGDDIYKFLFAPRFSTKNNASDSVWAVGQADSWECGVRNGGAVMQTSYYDVVARSLVGGADDAFSRLKGIESFYTAVRRSGGEGTGFYRKYFENLGIGMQGNYDADGDGVADGDSEGPVGIDCEFLEAALMFVSVPDAFFGLEPNYDGTLAVQPRMPASLDYWRMENLLFGGVSYDLSIGKYFVQLSNVQQSSSLSMEVRLAKPSFKFKVFYNGAQAQYKEENGSIVVKVPFENGKVEIKGV